MNKHKELVYASSMIDINKENFYITQERIESAGILHWHDYNEIGIVFEGKGIHMADGEEYEIQKGSAFMLTPYSYHSVNAAQNTVLKLITINFNHNMLPESIQKYIKTQKEILFCSLNEASFSSFFNTVLKLKKCYESDDVYKDEMIKALFAQLCIEFLSNAQQPPAVYGKSPLVGEVIAYIKENFRQPFTKKDAARHFYITPNYLGDLFKKELRVPFISYLNKIRLQYAANLLCNSDMNVTAICFESGFNTPSYFIRAFKIQFGITPAAYRKLNSSGR